MTGAGGQRDGGQALVETALVMPLFVFVMLGTLQLGLMHQAHAMTKYAAYKAVRAGSLNHADHDVMKNAATAALLPMISIPTGGPEKIMPVKNIGDYIGKTLLVRAMGAIMSPVDVKICGPTKNNARVTTGIDGAARRAAQEIQFDAPVNVGQLDWKASERTKLRIEVTFNYRMPIPFANMLIYQIARGNEDAELLWVTRMGDPNPPKIAADRAIYDAMAAAGQGYVLPIRATYAMRMMSDLYPDKAGFQLPTSNTCRVGFPKGGGE